jgi:flagellar L-ring protein precursor FlgH
MRRLTAGLGLWLALAPAFADSLYSAAGFHPLVSDHRAYRQGDNLTVLITEIASVTATASTSTNKQGSVAGNLVRPTDSKNYGATLEEDFRGGGTIERSGKLVAQLTVAVLAVEPNGDLRVKGEQEIEVNNERQWIALEGRVRPQDIESNNTVLSTRVSEAKIKYTGKGLLAEKERPGILTRFLSWLRIL